MAESKFIRFVLFLMLASYYYNLAVFNYSLTGHNELRLYDFVGLGVLYLYLQNMPTMNVFIKSKPYTKFLYDFVVYAFFMMFVTWIVSLVNNRSVWVMRSALFMYHLIIFYLSYVFFLVQMRNAKFYAQFITFMSIFTIAAALVVILQHTGVVGYLWSEGDQIAYNGFFSGTLGPNKIVLGMTMFISFATLTGIYLNKSAKVNRILLITAIAISLVALVLSGSRTSYVGIIVFSAYFFWKGTGKFIYLGAVLALFALVLSLYDSFLIERIVEVIEGRVVNRISNPNEIFQGDVGQLYDDLGAGRNQLSSRYIDYLINNFYIIPFGSGFVNYVMVGPSAHNIYLSLINEVGIVGLVMYLRWLWSYLKIDLREWSFHKVMLSGLTLGMLITLLFGEHLYVYRPLFGILGLFLFATAVLISPKYFGNTTN